MKSNRGFTLIEVLVVLVIIAMLVSITVINTDHDPRSDYLNAEAERFKFYLEAASDEAVLFNKNISILFSLNSMNPHSWEKSQEDEINNSNISNNPSTPSPIKRTWQPYSGRIINRLTTNNEIEISLFIDESNVQLPVSIENTKDINPELIIQTTGIQNIVRVRLSINDYEPYIDVRGNGAGRFIIERDDNET